ncbi:hypothetical protein GOP47_0026001 [Adiantum capillus-veneris]|uniref:Uncharacterized protein n=1 Tax=Adiantum capillus-veneris TaxID=13818 RepID=A0A9D4U1Z0_ADICA|nr:hypothetical protein GOP47_0026001 [Adiantum capillus-veneris]
MISWRLSRDKLKSLKCAQSKRVKEVLIQHAFQHADLKLQTSPGPSFPRHRPNYIYPSNTTDWQLVESIVGIFYAFHAFIGEEMYRGRQHKELADNEIFFYDMSYLEPRTSFGWGRVAPLSLPSFDNKDWSLPAS